MTIEEAKKHGCPPHLLSKMAAFGIVSFTVPHNLDGINWDTVESNIDKLVLDVISSKYDIETDTEDGPTKNRWEILDL